MNKISRKILIVDDSNTVELKIDNYLLIFNKLKNTTEHNQCNYDIEFVWEKTITSAIDRLNNKLEVFDVILVDYRFNNDENNKKGTDLVKEIRSTINRKCKIIFYTMEGYEGISKNEYIELINSDVFRFISKSGETLENGQVQYKTKNADESIVRAIIDSIVETDPISNVLENFLVEYYEILKETKINVEDGEYTLRQLIDSIRLDIEPGKTFVEKMLKMAMFDYIDFLK